MAEPGNDAVTPHDDLATLRACLKNPTLIYSRKATEALARLETELARLQETQVTTEHAKQALDLALRAEAAEAEVTRLREGLRFYADPMSYQETAAGSPNASGIYETTSVPVLDDHGDLARSLLADNQEPQCGVAGHRCDNWPECSHVLATLERADNQEASE